MTNRFDDFLFNPIFIVGAPRSGTTLLQYMLRSHPNISLPTGESHFFIPLFENRKQYGDLAKPENVRQVIETMHSNNMEFMESDFHGFNLNIDSLVAELCASGCNTIPKIINGVYGKNALGENKKRWGEKTPYYILHMNILKEMFPYAKFIHIIRDGRDAALSMLRRKYDLKIFNMYHAAKVWDRYVTTGIKTGSALGPDSYFQLRYEDLLSDPETNLQGICRFIGEPFDDSVVNFKPASDPYGKTPLLKGGLKKSNTEKWKIEMSKLQLRVFETEAGHTLRDCGYNITVGGNGDVLAWLISILYRIQIRYHWMRMNAKHAG